MYDYFFVLLNVWLISATESPPEKPKVLNHTPLILGNIVGLYRYPYKAYITDDQIQEYYYDKKHDGRYFCPLENNEANGDLIKEIERSKVTEYQYCLFEKVFKKGEEKICPGEVKPLIVEKRDDSGQENCGSGYLYKFIYEICVKKSKMKTIKRYFSRGKRPKIDLFSDVRHPRLYEVCFNHSDIGDNPRAVIFTEHKIRSPYILRNLALAEERAMHNLSQPYSIEGYGLDNLRNLKKIQTAYDAERESRKRFLPQMLVPMYDFALGHWMRTTMHILNYSPQDIYLEPLWRTINAHVYRRLIKLYDEIGDVRIFTGTWGQFTDQKGNIVYVGDDTNSQVSIPLIWWKLLYAWRVKQALVIIMKNVPNEERVCPEEQNVCDVSKWEYTYQLQSWHNDFIYCCKMSSAKDKIRTLLHLKVHELGDVLKLD